MTLIAPGGRPEGTVDSLRELRVVLAGGGTAGHVSPALALADALQERAPGRGLEPRFLFVGGRNGIEEGLVRATGMPFAGVEAGKVRRAPTRIGLVTRANAADMVRTVVGVTQAFKHLRQFRPDVVVGMGGFASAPAVIAGWMLRAGIVVHEQTIRMGLTNRRAARFADVIALSFAEARSVLPARLHSRTIVAGNPIRRAVFGGDPERAVRRFGFAPEDAGLPIVYITGGSSGAASLNAIVARALPELLQRTRIIHQTGAAASAQSDLDRLSAVAAGQPDHLRRRCYVTPFLADDLADALAAADVVVSRSGANTVLELAALGKPAILVPLGTSAGNEQARNARWAEAAGAARVVPQEDLNEARLLEEVVMLLDDPPRRERMRAAALAIGHPSAATALADAVLDVAARRPPRRPPRAQTK